VNNQFIPHILSTKLKSALLDYQANILLSDDACNLTGGQIAELITPIIQSLNSSTDSGDVIGIALPHGILQVLTIIAIIISDRIPIVYKEKDSFTMIDQNEMSLLITSLDDMRFSLISMNEKNFGVLKRVASNKIKLETKIVKKQKTFHKLPSDVGMILYTSGSTGTAHGVMIPALGTVFLANALQKEFALNQQSTSTVILPLSHTMCINTHFFPTILSGGNSYITPTLSDLNNVYRNILKSNGDNLALISDLLPYLLQEKNIRNLPDALHVKILALSGGMITNSDIKFAQKLFPNAKIYKGYGLTEATRVAIMCTHNTSSNTPEDTGYRLLEDVEIQIRDGRNRLCKPGQEGYIFIKSKTVMKGYYNEATNVIDSKGFLKSGDMGFMSSEGRLFILGRSDGIIKINGERISGTHIEEMAMNSEDVKKYYSDAVCLPVKTGGRNKAYLFLESGDTELLSIEWLKKKLKQDLKRKFKVPIEIVEKKVFPRSDAGKILRKELYEILS